MQNRKVKFLFLLIFCNISFADAQTTAIPDSVFEQALINLGYDTVPIDGVVLTANIDTITNLYLYNLNISSLNGIEDFKELLYLNCSKNQLTSLDLTQNTKLISLGCGDNQLTNLVVTQNSALTNLSCWKNQLTSLNVTQNTDLQIFYCDENNLTSLDVTQNIDLIFFDCGENQLLDLDVTQNTNLVTIRCTYNQITKLDVTRITDLSILYCGVNQLANLDLAQNSILGQLSCSSNLMTSLDITQNTNLIELNCAANLLTSLDISQNTGLTSLSCGNNQLNCLNMKNGNNMNITIVNALNNPNLTCIEVDNAAYSSSNWEDVDSIASFSTNCNNSCISAISDEDYTRLSIYPNPFISIFQINSNEQSKVVLFDILGKQIEAPYRSNNEILEVDGSNLESGVYIAVILDSNGDVIGRNKVVKN